LKPTSNYTIKSNLGRIFLFWIIINGIGLGFLDTITCFYEDLPWEPNTEYLQETGYFQGKDVSYLDVFDVPGLEKTAVSPRIFYGIYQQHPPFFNYKEKLSKQTSLGFAPLSSFQVRSKFNIPHLNCEDEDPFSFPLEVVKIS